VPKNDEQRIRKLVSGILVFSLMHLVLTWALLRIVDTLHRQIATNLDYAQVV